MDRRTTRGTAYALFGGKPAFSRPIPLGQRYFPSAERYAQAFREIFERQYYTEYGPLNRELELKLETLLGVKHAICVTNETVGLMMTVEAMGIRGKVLVPATAVATAVQPLVWAGLEPVFCEVEQDMHHIDVGLLAGSLNAQVSAVMGAHLWGGACDARALESFAQAHELQLYFDATHAFGCEIGGVHIGNFGRAEILSFHQDNILNGAEGGCICTTDDELAAHLRTMRGSAGAGEPVPVTKTVNGRFSEAQAALALMALDDFPANRGRNEELHGHYERALAAIPGLHLVKPGGVTTSNFQSALCRVSETDYGLSRDTAVALLNAENVCARPLPPVAPTLDNARAFSDSCLQLPLGALTSVEDIEGICAILIRAHADASRIRRNIKLPRG